MTDWLEDLFDWWADVRRPVRDSAPAAPDLNACPNCGGPADNGHDRCYPPSPYWCTKCSAPAVPWGKPVENAFTPWPDEWVKDGDEVEEFKMENCTFATGAQAVSTNPPAISSELADADSASVSMEKNA